MSARRYLPPAEMRHALIQGPWRTRSLDERMTGRFPRRLPKKTRGPFPAGAGTAAAGAEKAAHTRIILPGRGQTAILWALRCGGRFYLSRRVGKT